MVKLLALFDIRRVFCPPHRLKLILIEGFDTSACRRRLLESAQ